MNMIKVKWTMKVQDKPQTTNYTMLIFLSLQHLNKLLPAKAENGFDPRVSDPCLSSLSVYVVQLMSALRTYISACICEIGVVELR